jgi:putative transposase
MFRKEKNAEMCKNAIMKVAQNHKIEINEISVMPDHVHVIAQIPPTMSQSEAIRILKGGSSYEIFRMNPKFRLRYQHGSLWSRGNFKDSVGCLTEDAAEEYLCNQDMHHLKKSAGFSPQYLEEHF